VHSRENVSEVHAGGLVDVDIEVGAEELRVHLSDVLSQVAYGERRALVTRHGRPLAVILPVADAVHYAELVDADDRAALAAMGPVGAPEAAGTARG